MPSTLVSNVIAAVTLCGLRFRAPADVALASGPWMSLFSVSLRSLARLLQWTIAQHAYQRACRGKRADIVSGPSGLLDVALTRSPWLVPPGLGWNSFVRAFPSNRAVAPAVVVGSAATADRLYASNLAASPGCRFCDGADETLAHLVQCGALHARIGLPPAQREDQGPSFYTHALAEIPADLAHAALRAVPWPATTPLPRYGGGDVHLWTDGSVYLPHHLLFAAAGFAVVSASAGVCAAGPLADNYRAEVYAILHAAQLACGRLTVHTDSQAAVSAWHGFHLRGCPSQRCGG